MEEAVDQPNEDGRKALQARRPEPRDPLAALFRFHGEIRSSLSLLESLADEPHTVEVARTHRERARALLHFCSGPLVWHDIDEECSLLPRLQHRVYSEEHELEGALPQIRYEHARMERLLEPVLVYLSGLAAGRRPERSFAQDVERLCNHVVPHLANEERDLFPFARLVLTEEDLRALAEELHERAAARADDEDVAPLT